jgi:DNA-binding helix-hairpin-helix protein with protein kinase domain
MMTKPSSSHHVPQTHPPQFNELFDSQGRAIRLGTLVGRGGEGAVFAVEGAPSLAAKIYHQLPLGKDDIDKLLAVVARRSLQLESIAAWPQSVLYRGRHREPCGILLPRVADSYHLHELYGTSNRRRHFPEAQWHHLVLAARNVAAAFASLHAIGVIVGDVNQGNLLVDRQMRVQFIDCDSFQVMHDGKTFVCPVGTPHFTPAELQSKKLREVPRAANHDRFGLAVLLFHLLFVGRHPFAGRYYGSGELNIEKAIAERRFAFSKDKASTLVEPPPASLLLDDLPQSIGALFEQAFRGRPDDARPTAEQWVTQLEGLLRQRRTCSYDPAHVYFSALAECPWCRIEDEGGPAFFVSGDSMVAAPAERMEHLEDKLRRLTVPSFPSLSPQRFVIPQEVRPKKWRRLIKPTSIDLAAWLLAASMIVCLFAARSFWVLLAGSAGAVTGGAVLLLSQRGKSKRKRVHDLRRRLDELQKLLRSESQQTLARHHRRQSAFKSSVSELKVECEQYCTADTQLENVLVMSRAAELNRFLSRHIIQEHVSQIFGMTAPMAAVLQSYGVESAADIESLKLLGIPMLTPGLTLELTNWREVLEHDFVYKPDHGVTFTHVNTAGEVAVKRFKTFQARRILMAGKQLDSVARAAREQLAAEVAHYDERAAQARDVAYELRDFQTARGRLEQLVNYSREVLLAVTLATPAVGGLIWLLFG